MAENTVDRGSQRRRLTTFLLAALAVMLVLLGALVWFFLRVSRPAGPDVTSAVSTGGVKMSVGEQYYGFGEGVSGQFLRPHDVSVGSDGDLYVADMGNGRVLRLNPRGQLIGRYGTQAWGPKQIDSPTGIAVGPDGRIYVADTGVRGPHGKVLIMSADLKTVVKEMFFKPGDPPIMVRVYGDQLYVTSRTGVHIYSLDGKLLREWGSAGKAEGQFSYPNGIALLPDSTIVVAESNNVRLQFFDQRGKYLRSAGKPPTGMQDSGLKYGLPMGLAIDDRGVMYLTDAFDYSIRLLGPNGDQFASVGEFGKAKGQFNAPGGLSLAPDGSLWVADELNNRIVNVTIDVPASSLPAGVVKKKGISAVDVKSIFGSSVCLWAIPLLFLLLLTVFLVVRRMRAGAYEDDEDDEDGEGLGE